LPHLNFNQNNHFASNLLRLRGCYGLFRRLSIEWPVHSAGARSLPWQPAGHRRVHRKGGLPAERERERKGDW